VEAMIELDQLGQCSLVRENHGGIRLGLIQNLGAADS
jgi:hypothetical protein